MVEKEREEGNLLGCFGYGVGRRVRDGIPCGWLMGHTPVSIYVFENRRRVPFPPLPTKPRLCLAGLTSRFSRNSFSFLKSKLEFSLLKRFIQGHHSPLSPYIEMRAR